MPSSLAFFLFILFLKKTSLYNIIAPSLIYIFILGPFMVGDDFILWISFFFDVYKLISLEPWISSFLYHACTLSLHTNFWNDGIRLDHQRQNLNDMFLILSNFYWGLSWLEVTLPLKVVCIGCLSCDTLWSWMAFIGSFLLSLCWACVRQIFSNLSIYIISCIWSKHYNLTMNNVFLYIWIIS